jgi:hypothetical protein
MRRILLLALLALSFAACGQGPAAPAGTRVLIIGNSYVARPDLAARLQGLAKAMGRDARVELVARDDASLEDHWAGGAARERIAAGWDYVILQQGPSARRDSRRALSRDARRFADAIQRTGAKPVLFSAWPARSEAEDFPAAIESYRAVAAEIGGLLIPAAEAWLRAIARDASVRLYADGLHASQAGADLALLATWFTLFPAGPQDFNEAYVQRIARELHMEAKSRDALFDAATRAVDEPLPLRLK